jgi:hypothetical protein
VPCLQAKDVTNETDNGEIAQASLLGRRGRSRLGFLELTMGIRNAAAGALELLGFNWIAAAHEENHEEQEEEREKSTLEKHCY